MIALHLFVLAQLYPVIHHTAVRNTVVCSTEGLVPTAQYSSQYGSPQYTIVLTVL